MNCNDVRPLLEAHVDDELELGHRLSIEHHLRECASCRELAAGMQARRAVIREGLPRLTAPDVLTARIRASLRTMPAAKSAALAQGPVPFRWGNYVRWSAAIAAGLMLGAFGGFQWGRARSRSEAVVARVVENHVRSLLPGHLTDVTSTDQHTVKPWFAGRLPFSPAVIDLAASGFPLIGGRLERIGEQPAAALVYQRAQHRINLLIWPASSGETVPEKTAADGYHVVAWTYSGFTYVAVSDLQERELAQFAGEIREKLVP